MPTNLMCLVCCFAYFAILSYFAVLTNSKFCGLLSNESCFRLCVLQHMYPGRQKGVSTHKALDLLLCPWSNFEKVFHSFEVLGHLIFKYVLLFLACYIFVSFFGHAKIISFFIPLICFLAYKGQSLNINVWNLNVSIFYLILFPNMFKFEKK